MEAWWSSLFVDMSPASFFNFRFLPKYASFFIQGVDGIKFVQQSDAVIAVVFDDPEFTTLFQCE